MKKAWPIRRGLLEVAYATAHITDPGDETRLLGGLGLAPAWEHVAHLGDLTFDRRLEELFPKGTSGLVFERPQVIAESARNGCRDDLAVADVEAEGLQVAVFEAVSARIERSESLGFVDFYRCDGFFEPRDYLSCELMRRGNREVASMMARPNWLLLIQLPSVPVQLIRLPRLALGSSAIRNARGF
jgi:hypothetical protein